MIKGLFNKTLNHQYPLMRDPKRNPKCYELTDREREEAVKRVDQLLRERDLKRTQGYYGA